MKEYLITFHTHYDSLVCMRAVNKTDNAKTGDLTAALCKFKLRHCIKINF